MRIHDSRMDVLRILATLTRIGDECDRRIGAGAAPPEITTLLGIVRPAAGKIRDADDRKQRAIADARHADADLESAYVAGLHDGDRAKGMLVALFGRQAAELSKFGVKPLRGGRTLPGSNVKTQTGSMSGPSPATTTGTSGVNHG